MGGKGVENVISFELDADEKKQFLRSAEITRKNIPANFAFAR
jgi:malate/lactate dehydrogenase